jgi:hypothetical protein
VQLPPTALVLDVLTKAVLPPAGASFAVAAAFLAFRRPGLAAPAAALALAAGLAAGIARTEALPWRPDGRALHWLPYAAAAALLAGLASRVPKVPASLGALLQAGVACLAAAWLLPIKDPDTPFWLGPAFVWAVLVMSAVADAAGRAAPGGAVPFALALAAGGASGVLIHAHSALMTELATVLGAALAGLAVAAWLFRADAGAAAPGAVTFLAGLLVIGQSETFSEVPVAAFATAALAPLGLVVTLLPFVGKLKGFRQVAVILTCVIIPVAVAVVLAARAESLSFG